MEILGMFNTEEKQKQIDEANKDLKGLGYEWYITEDGDVSARKIENNKCKNCGSSSWELYRGFRFEFEYCPNCGEKKE